MARSAAAERLASATGGAVESGEGGTRTVHFPSPSAGGLPGPLTQQQPYTVSRVIDIPEMQVPAQAPSGDGGHADKQAGGMDMEAAYEYFLDRFKRDLLIEREQSGHLVIDNP